MRIFTGRRLKLESLIFSPDGQLLACAGKPTDSAYLEVRVLEVTGDGLAKQKASMVTGSISFSPDGQFLFLPSRHLWFRMGVADGHFERDETLASLNPAEVCPNGRRALTAAVNASAGMIAVSIAEYRDDTWRTTWNRNIWYECYGRPGAKAADTWEQFNEVRIAADAGRIMIRFNVAHHDCPSVGSRVLVVDAANGETVSDWRGTAYLTGHTGEISPDGRLLFWHSRAFQVIDPTASGCDPITRTNSSRKHFTAAAFSPDGKLLATTSNDTTVTMWDTTTWQPMRQYGWEIGKLRAVAFAPDGLTCAAGSDTGKVVLFDVDG